MSVLLPPTTAASSDASLNSYWTLAGLYNRVLTASHRLPEAALIDETRRERYAVAKHQFTACLHEVREIVTGFGSEEPLDALAARLQQALPLMGQLFSELVREGYQATQDPTLGHVMRCIDGAQQQDAAPSAELVALRLPNRTAAPAASLEDGSGCGCASRREPEREACPGASGPCLHYRCMVCLEAKVDFRAYDACGHPVCDDCSGQLARRPALDCPKCRAPSDKLVPLQMPDAVWLMPPEPEMVR
jgi:hypothetical protein